MGQTPPGFDIEILPFPAKLSINDIKAGRRRLRQIPSMGIGGPVCDSG